MQARPHSYLFSISYFGARYKGWAPQPNQPTVQRRLERVLRHVIGHEDFSLIGASRTDSGVSCRAGFVQVFLREKIEIDRLLPELNLHLPSDIRLNTVTSVATNFNLIQAVTQKTYRYYFSSDTDFHPLASAYMERIHENLDVGLMIEAASLFVGVHDFKAFCKPAPNKTNYEREVIKAKIELNTDFSGPFFPDEVYHFEISGTGFLHHQVRKMMTAIWNVGKGEWQLTDISDRLKNPEILWPNLPPAPANGLILWETRLKD